MLFNSYIFIFAFMPAVIALYALARRFSAMLGLAVLFAGSLVFYSWWDEDYLILLLVSICMNYAAGRIIGWCRQPQLRFGAMAAAVAGNLGVIAYYKYTNFVFAAVASLFGLSAPAYDIVMPLGISFFTFTQIAFLVDTYRKSAYEYNPLHYALFIVYFPHLIAGPILHHAEIVPQFRAAPKISWEDLSVGLSTFVIGLGKKVLVADTIAPIADRLFQTPDSEIGFFTAWAGALAYTLQIFFDFSGYSDMAIGVSRMLGIRLPLNFDSPYKAASIIDFWRRWHMTLSRFLRDYLYIALGGNRRGRLRRYANLLLTMLLGGLWHGANWTYLVWGLLHGVYLVINHVWRHLRGGIGDGEAGRIERCAGHCLTLMAVIVAWVFFRAGDLDAALRILKGMVGFQGYAMPKGLLPALGPLGGWLAEAGVPFVHAAPLSDSLLDGALLAGFLALALFAPDTHDIMRNYRPALTGGTQGAYPAWMAWRPSLLWGLLIAGLLAAAIPAMSHRSEFLYFIF